MLQANILKSCESGFDGVFSLGRNKKPRITVVVCTNRICLHVSANRFDFYLR